MLVKCNCNNCPSHLEFDSADAGTVIVCPKCGMETTLFIPAVKKPPPPAGLPVSSANPTPPPDPLPVSAPPPPPTVLMPGLRKSVLLYAGVRIVLAVVVIAGLLLILVGCSGELTESTHENGSAVRQTVFAIQYGTGLILLGLGAVLELLVAIARK